MAGQRRPGTWGGAVWEQQLEKRGSKRRRKAVARVAALHAKGRRQRRDGAYKAALTLVGDYGVIVHEALQVPNMTRRAAPRSDGAGG
ncbi:hypothetical protein [Nonomuraea sp. KM90]|uniref:hypothetical protein n=1 Tax=Nonomuraea sp. KM90 TaxID=3457428 RepID=UPI003FCE2A95